MFDPQKFGMMKEPPTNLADALKQIFFDPTLLAVYALTFVVALLFPLLITWAMRKWNQWKLAKCAGANKIKVPAEEEQTDPTVELPNGMFGCFNKSILDCLNSPKSKDGCPFTPRENLTLNEDLEGEEKEEAEETRRKEEKDEDLPELESTDESKVLLNEAGGEAKAKKPRKKYKDPDPETAEALNKLIEQGLHGKLATAQLRAKTHILEEQMTEEERKNEANIRQEQLAKIFQMMESQKEKFGINEKEELVEQMKLYNI